MSLLKTREGILPIFLIVYLQLNSEFLGSNERHTNNPTQ